MAHVILLADYRRGFWFSTKSVHTTESLDAERIRKELEVLGHDVEIVNFAELDLSKSDLVGSFVLYTSSEDVGGLYKRFIEAKIFGLKMVGAHPVPEPELLLAHHDKVMMESVRQARLGEALGQPWSWTFGSLEDFVAADVAVPVVLKPATGAGSRGVSLARDPKQAARAARKLSRSMDMPGTFFELAKRLRRRHYVPRSLHRRPFVLQQFLPGLQGDYKVLRLGRRFYILGRANRPNDFRASGGGRLNYAPHKDIDVTPILDAAADWAEALGSPFCSLDVAYDPQLEQGPQLIEFQCVNFGPVTAENSFCYYTRNSSGWERIEEQCDFEMVFAEAASEHINRVVPSIGSL
ncbi:RimK family alpha-L-glutamate ligase [Arthrobacter sp. RT-1]|uniref:ATP-grasp domain-containing protein n=1 Tax=Arthrobacter sp. RT-1 TaxID=2292263 RepID=UPI0011C0729F|nr:hypothetical protein [Arthrobacter sp. RT-1]